ncbi:hypothetical protein NC651_014688 [Populus alba x Populus x berolinensis]|nr:hypothetical protein NC651_014688 [Populus alba x Populus x berolinensis]
MRAIPWAGGLERSESLLIVDVVESMRRLAAAVSYAQHPSQITLAACSGMNPSSNDFCRDREFDGLNEQLEEDARCPRTSPTPTSARKK